MNNHNIVLVSIVIFFTFSILAFSQIDPLSTWTYKDSTFHYVSGIMDLTNSMDSLKVFLTNQNIDCNDLPIAPNEKPGAWIEIKFREFAVKNYALGEIWCTMSCRIFGSYYDSYIGYLGTAAITSIDTINRRVYGCLDIETNAFEFPLIAYGSFNVPYCASTASYILPYSNNGKPIQFELEQNYPNPFNPLTKIKFSIARPNHVNIDVYNIVGQKVLNLVDKHLSAGKHEVTLNGENWSSGIYLYKIEAGTFRDIKRMILMR
jgi:hypothetical protein